MEKKLNAAEKIREAMGCYNIMLHKMPAAPKKKKIAYGENMRMAQAVRQATPQRLQAHKNHLAKMKSKRLVRAFLAA